MALSKLVGWRTLVAPRAQTGFPGRTPVDVYRGAGAHINGNHYVPVFPIGSVRLTDAMLSLPIERLYPPPVPGSWGPADPPPPPPTLPGCPAPDVRGGADASAVAVDGDLDGDNGGFGGGDGIGGHPTRLPSPHIEPPPPLDLEALICEHLEECRVLGPC